MLTKLHPKSLKSGLGMRDEGEKDVEGGWDSQVAELGKVTVAEKDPLQLADLQSHHRVELIERLKG